ncbi:MAG: MarR family winged helix-turn-helix transcriptional regulator [Nitrosotalea sp.]
MRDKLRILDYKNSVAFISRNASKVLEKALDAELLLGYNLSGAQWKVIASLAISNGLSQKELADFLSLDSSTLVPVIDKMEQNGFVTRKPDPNDRRNNRIFITKKSESVIDSIVDAILKLRKAVYKDISTRDIEITKKVLQKMTENAESFISEKPKRAENKARKKK